MADGNFIPIVKKKYVEKEKELSFKDMEVGETFIAMVCGVKFLGMLIEKSDTGEYYVLDLSAPTCSSDLGFFYELEECELLYMQQISIEEL